ncbi:hypothetical protein KP79_PYT24548 [Mizuhopecten yessoensis]|uniref:Uncharacterized protein n=1 Tax=Mizuhopecten yessoensis TaxID=6573 RepID=A0A210Q0V2_MIZYE|nr:hypothetical protein KP79_PYT24548 [Mizuhopecten yessoensis]
MLDSTDSEQMSVLLSKYLDHDYTGTQEDAYIRKKAHTLLEHLNNHPMISICFAGSMAEGIQVPGSDSDEMLIDEHVTVMYPDQCIPPDTVYKTILLIRKADCRPGYVHLQLEQIGQKCQEPLILSLVKIKDSLFVSGDIFREQWVSAAIELSGVKFESNGPSCTTKYPSGD